MSFRDDELTWSELLDMELALRRGDGMSFAQQERALEVLRDLLDGADDDDFEDDGDDYPGRYDDNGGALHPDDADDF